MILITKTKKLNTKFKLINVPSDNKKIKEFCREITKELQEIKNLLK